MSILNRSLLSQAHLNPRLTDEQTQVVDEDKAMKPEEAVELQDQDRTDTRGWGFLWKWLGVVKRQKPQPKL